MCKLNSKRFRSTHRATKLETTEMISAEERMSNGKENKQKEQTIIRFDEENITQ